MKISKGGYRMLRCGPHTSGVTPGMEPFFVDWCDRCQANLKAGKVTGKEGPPKLGTMSQRSKAGYRLMLQKRRAWALTMERQKKLFGGV